MRKNFPMLFLAVSLKTNEDEIYPLLFGGSAVTIVVDACVDDAASGTCECMRQVESIYFDEFL